MYRSPLSTVFLASPKCPNGENFIPNRFLVVGLYRIDSTSSPFWPVSVWAACEVAPSSSNAVYVDTPPSMPPSSGVYRLTRQPPAHGACSYPWHILDHLDVPRGALLFRWEGSSSHTTSLGMHRSSHYFSMDGTLSWNFPLGTPILVGHVTPDGTPDGIFHRTWDFPWDS